MVAVLILPYNRVAETRQVIEALLRNPPSRLYIGADGPRMQAPEDAARCAEVRQLLSSVAWPCEVFERYQERNLGCSAAITHHLDWFFSHEESGVILEDDCVPHPRFLDFCGALLDRYRSDARFMSISGFNPLPPDGKAGDYWASVFCLSWGWATWRRAWAMYRPRLDGLESFLADNRFPGAARDAPIAERWTDRFRLAEQRSDYSWFVNWTYSCWVQGGLTLVSDVNLIRNVGLSKLGSQDPGLEVPGADVAYGQPGWPLVHPDRLEADPDQDRAFMRTFFRL
jgi:hypothetical protein